MGNFGAYTEWRHCSISGKKISEQLCLDRQSCGSLHCAQCHYQIKEKKMGDKKARCKVDGCENQAWKQGMCYHHFHKQAKEGTVSQKTAAKTSTPPPAVEVQADQSRLSLLDRVSVVDTPLSRPGFFLDFTGKEDLLTAFQNLSSDMNNDTLSLLELSIAGVLRRVA